VAGLTPPPPPPVLVEEYVTDDVDGDIVGMELVLEVGTGCGVKPSATRK
jgi:hypothetical protein